MSNIYALYYFVCFSIKIITQTPFSRSGDHSTMASDDKAMHRSSKEVDYWQTELNPIVRLRRYMENKNWWNNQMEDDWKRDALFKETSQKNKS